MEKTWAPKNSTLIVVGDLDFADAEKQVRGIWGDWRKKDPGTPQATIPMQPEPPARSMALIDSADATQADVTVVCQLDPGGKMPAYNVLSGLLTETLWTAIRERSGASYGVYAQAATQRDKVGYLAASGLIQNDKAVNGLKTILDGIQDLKAGKVDAATLMRTKWNIARTSYVAFQSNDDMLASIESILRRGVPLSAYQSFPDDLANVSVKDIQALLEPCAGHEVVSVVGPQKTLKPALDALKIPVEVVDWQKSGGKPNEGSKASLH
jgi:predicted Zn-dependent peptidase